jgi:hypothetical protein
MNQLLGSFLTCGCLGFSLLMAIPAIAETPIEFDQNMATVRSKKALPENLKSFDSENTVIRAETEVAENTTEAVTTQISNRRPLPCRIFPAASMSQ